MDQPRGAAGAVDANGDGIYDSFHSNATGQTTHVLRQADGTYLIDVNGDGVWDYVYNPLSGTYTAYSATPGVGPGWPLWQGGLLLIIIIIIIFILFLLWRRRKKDEEKKKK